MIYPLSRTQDPILVAGWVLKGDQTTPHVASTHVNSFWIVIENHSFLP